MSTNDVLLGYEVGSGVPVRLPLRHLAVTGQTQESGKTTTLEALVDRSGVQAVVFLTKRGEGSFTGARVIPPYFREQADWQFVASILEASRGEKMRFERAWIIRASQRATTLADVQRNVRKAMKTAKGMSADVYLTLDAYLDAVVPQIGAVQWAPSVALQPGINAMDLTALGVEMQHLVIRSTIDWVLQHARNTVVVVPEAWKFIPQGRGTPVKLAAEAYIRQAAGLGNYLWLDSQDIAGVEKIILKSVPVWILGVQREANEIKRTLAQIPAGIKKPTPAEIATLGIGEFFACYGRHTVKTYVQPAWMSESAARAIATRRETVRTTPLPPASTTSENSSEEDTVNEQEAAALRDENAELRRKLEKLERELLAQAASHRSITVTVPPDGSSGHARIFPRDDQAASNAALAVPPGAGAAQAPDDDAVFQRFKRRLIQELLDERSPLLRVLAERPEIQVIDERQVIEVRGDTLRGRIAKLIAEGFFEQSRTSADVSAELERRGKKPSNIELGNELKALTEMGFFTRSNKWLTLVPKMVVNVIER